jgi:hypothetical protein
MEVSSQLHAPAALTPGKSHCTHWIWDQIGHWAGSDAVEKRRTSRHAVIRNLTVQPVIRQYMDWDIQGIEFLCSTVCRQFIQPPSLLLAQFLKHVSCCKFWHNSTRPLQTLLPVLMSHAPAGSSAKSFFHYAQDMNSGKLFSHIYYLNHMKS